MPPWQCKRSDLITAIQITDSAALLVQQWREDEQAQANLHAAVAACLNLVFRESLEVPVIAMHHKGVLGELLCTREFEVPDVVTVRPMSSSLLSLACLFASFLSFFSLLGRGA